MGEQQACCREAWQAHGHPEQSGEADCPTCPSISQRSQCAERFCILHTHKTLAMQSIPDARQQSFEELYGPPENFLEIEVRAPL